MNYIQTLANNIAYDNGLADMKLELSVHKSKGLGCYVIASVYYSMHRNGYSMKSFLMHKDFNKRIEATIMRAGRVTDKLQQQSLDKALDELPPIINAVKAHYAAENIQWTV